MTISRRSVVSSSPAYQHNHIPVSNEVFLHTLEYGDRDSGKAPVVLLIHGFPDLCLSWQYHAERLAQEGYFVVTPDLRGFGASSMPKEGVAAYGRQNLVSDINELRKYYCGGENGSFALLVGHDWGGVIVWATLGAYGIQPSPDVAISDDGPTGIAQCAVIMNAPHPRIFFQHITTFKQAFKSWYILFFQLPWLPEFVLHWTNLLYRGVLKNEYLELAKNLDQSTTTSTFKLLDVDRNLKVYESALTGYDRISAMLSYYRSIHAGLWREPQETSGPTLVNRIIRWLHGIEIEVGKQPSDRSPEIGSEITTDGTTAHGITIPTLVLWGEKDLFLETKLATPPADTVKNFHGVEYFDDAGHCVQWEKPVETADRLISFAREHHNEWGIGR